MELKVRNFGDLTVRELYALLRLRASVFVVEQNCPYLDPDGRDPNALHVWLEDENEILAYLRILGPDAGCPYVSIGRVISVKRRTGLGSMILQEGMRLARERFGADRVHVEAQVYAKPFYERQGFRAVSEPFYEDGIPHIRMIADLRAPAE